MAKAIGTVLERMERLRGKLLRVEAEMEAFEVEMEIRLQLFRADLATLDGLARARRPAARRADSGSAK